MLLRKLQVKQCLVKVVTTIARDNRIFKRSYPKGAILYLLWCSSLGALLSSPTWASGW